MLRSPRSSAALQQTSRAFESSEAKIPPTRPIFQTPAGGGGERDAGLYLLLRLSLISFSRSQRRIIHSGMNRAASGW